MSGRLIEWTKRIVNSITADTACILPLDCTICFDLKVGSRVTVVENDSSFFEMTDEEIVAKLECRYRGGRGGGGV